MSSRSFKTVSRPPTTAPMPGRSVLRRMARALCYVAIVVGLALGLYLTLRPTGSFADLWWMPRSVRHWAEYNGRLRNFPAYALLAVPFMIVANGRRARRGAIFWLAAFVALTELAQYYIPHRWCEWQDVAYGWAGLLVFWLGFELSFWGAWRFRQILKQRKSPGRTKAPAVIAQPARSTSRST